MKTRNVAMTSAGILLIGAIVVLSVGKSGSTINPPAGPGEVSSDVLRLRVDFDQHVVLTGDNDSQAMITVTANELANTHRSPVSMAIVLDTSGSMSGDKIANAQRAAHQLVERLHDGDIITVVGFNHDSYTVVANAELTSDRSNIYSAISNLTAGGGTCISCGMESAYQYLGQVPSGYQGKVLVLSDGRGSASAETLQVLAASAVERYATPTSAIGLGRDINELTMGALATGGTGDYYFMHNSAVMADILTQEMSALETTIASNVVIEVVPEPGVVIAGTDAFGARFDGTTLILPIGQMSAGAQRRFLVNLNLPTGDLGQVISTRVVYSDLDNTSQELATNGALVRSDDEMVVASSNNDDVLEMAAWWDSGRDVETAAGLVGEGRTEDAILVLEQQLAELDEEAEELDSAMLRAEREEVSQFLHTIQAAPSGSAAAVGSSGFNTARAQDRRRGRTDSDRYYQNEAFDFAQTE